MVTVLVCIISRSPSNVKRLCVCMISTFLLYTHTQSTGRSEIRGAHVMLFAVTLTMQRQVTHSLVKFYPTAFHTIKINEVTHATGTLMRLEVTPHSSRAHTHTHTQLSVALLQPFGGISVPEHVSQGEGTWQNKDCRSNAFNSPLRQGWRCVWQINMQTNDTHSSASGCV